jgi:hypothetical protein
MPTTRSLTGTMVENKKSLKARLVVNEHASHIIHHFLPGVILYY